MRLLNLLGITAALLAACGAPAADEAAITDEPLPSATAAPTAGLLTATGTPDAATPEPIRLTVWWPEPLAPQGDADASAELSRQLDAFQAAQSGLLVESRLKKADDIGGVLATLRAASAVAPGALPDVTLLRRADLLLAVTEGLVRPLERQVSSAILGDLYSAALELGQVNGQLYGLPYALEVQHLAYMPPATATDFTDFEALLTAGRPFTFAAGVTSGLSDVLLIQYLAAGGSLSDLSVGVLNLAALQEVLSFYERAVAENVVTTAVLSFATSADYLDGLRDQTINAGVISSTAYLTLLALHPELGFAPIPTDSGQPLTTLDGYLWVITTPNPNRQAAAARLIDWMMDAGRQAAYTAAVRRLPSQRAALRQNVGLLSYYNFAEGLLNNAVVTLPQHTGSAAARAMQGALTAVITGSQSAEEAAASAAHQLGG